MLAQLIQFDQDFFLAINSGLSNPFFDAVMPYLRNRFFWAPLYLFLAVFFVRNYRRNGWFIIIFFLLTFAITDYLNSGILKSAFERLRPCNDPVLQVQFQTLVRCGSGYSFPSSHAANHFALGIFLVTVFYQRWKWILPLALLWAFGISFAQVYVGVHYPLDVLAGGIIGSIVGYLTGTVFLTFFGDKIWKPGY